MIYFFVKDQVLSGMRVGVNWHKVISCAAGDAAIVRRAIKRSGFTILQEKSEPISGYKPIYWKTFSRLEEK